MIEKNKKNNKKKKKKKKKTKYNRHYGDDRGRSTAATPAAV